MDKSLYKTVITKRGLKYSYASVAAECTTRETLLFVHGFPSTSYDWRHQVDFFSKAGFRLIIPDMLGAGDTDRPVDVGLFRFRDMAGDIIDILDAEHLGKVIVIGHDWGSVLTSRLASYYPARFKAYAFVALGYSPTAADFEPKKSMALIKQVLGYEVYGYWEFFCADGADKIIDDHIDSFFNLVHPSGPDMAKTHVAPRGAMKAWLLNDSRTPRASYITDEDAKHSTETAKKGGMGSSLNWYKSFYNGIATEDRDIPPENQTITQPVLYCACLKDHVCPPALYVPTMQKFCPNLSIKEFDASHWVMMQAVDEFNNGLLEWLNGII